MLLGRKLIGVGDTKRYVIDYSSWLTDGETLTAVVFAVSAGPATIVSHAISTDGLSVAFLVTGAVTTTTPFNITIAATTSLSQIKNDHVEIDVVAP